MAVAMESSNRIAVVTGGGSGIGRASARKLAALGFDIAVLDIDPVRANTVAEEVLASGRRACGLIVDVAVEDSVRTTFDAVRSRLGPISVLVSSAGIADFTTMDRMTAATFDRMIAVHLRGTFLCCRESFTDMAQQRFGRIVNIASVAGINGGGGPGLSHYAAAKAGIIGFTKALSFEGGPLGITVNAIAPGLIDTPLTRGAGAPDSLYDAIVARLPLRRIGQPEDIAGAVAYLVSDDASWVTGQVLSPNGGGSV